MAVVSDTSPLSYLILIGEVDVLHTLYGDVLIPPAVEKELRHPDGPGRTRRWIREPPTWLQVEKPPEESTWDIGGETEEKLWSLDPGERQAIQLAEASGPGPLVIDERDGRQVAKDVGVPITGTIGVLGEAASEGLVDAPEVVGRLQETSFRASEELYRWLLQRHS